MYSMIQYIYLDTLIIYYILQILKKNPTFLKAFNPIHYTLLQNFLKFWFHDDFVFQNCSFSYLYIIDSELTKSRISNNAFTTWLNRKYVYTIFF